VEHLLRATARAEARHFWFRGFRYFVEPLVRHATTGLSDVAILDCGCGTGSNVEWLSRFGSTWGFDLAATGLRIGLELGRTHLARASVAAAPFPSARFDLVTSFDVLYSLEQAIEGAAVAEMFRLTRPGGFVIVNVAAMAVLRGDHSVLSRELRRYSREELRLLLTNAGFEVIRLTHTNALLFPPMAVARAWQRWRGLSSEADSEQEISVPVAPINLALIALLKAESLWLPYVNSPFGSSLLALARKPGPRRG
jgi:SAM-dependent methyltransferase